MGKMLKVVRITCIVMFVLCPLCWLLNCSTTYAFYTDINAESSIIADIIANAFYLAACWLPIPSLGCAIAAFLLAKKKKRTTMAGILALIAVTLLIVPFAFTLSVTLPF